MMGHARTDSTVYGWINCALNWLQLWSGTSTFMLEDTGSNLSYLPKNWFSSLRSFLDMSDLQIQLDGIYTVKPRRQNDVVLMDQAAKWYSSPEMLDKINRMRLFLKVECLSDLCNAAGTHIESEPTCISRKRWPNLEQPGPLTIKAWNDFISNFTRDKSNKLWEPLKCWIHQPNDWKWIYDPVSDMVAEYDRQHKNYVYHEIKAKRRRHWDIYPLLAFTESKLPKNAIPLDRVGTNQVRKSSGWKKENTPDREPPQSFEEYISQLPEWEKSLIEQIWFNESTRLSFMEMLNSGDELLAASDGGVAEPHRYFGWVIGTKEEILCTCAGPTHGWPLSSMRAEGYGRLSILRFLHHYCKFYNLTPEQSGKIQMACDNKAIVKYENKSLNGSLTWTPTTSMLPSYDIVEQINQATKECQTTYTLEWIKGHQDKDKEFHKLSWLAQLNVYADHLATQERSRLWNESPNKGITGPTLPASKARLIRRGKPITGHEKRIMRRAIPAKRLRKYLVKKFKLSPKQDKQVHWKAFRKARQNIARNVRRFVTKMHMNWLPTNLRLSALHCTSKDCPKCKQEESISHLICCNHRKKWRDDMIRKLKLFLDYRKTPLEITTTIVSGIESFFDGNNNKQKDSELTWWDFIQGRLDTQWEKTLDDSYHLRGIHSAKTFNGES